MTFFNIVHLKLTVFCTQKSRWPVTAINSKVYTTLDNFQTGEKKQNNRGIEQTKA